MPELEDLAASLKQHGIVQPVVVRPSKVQAGRYEIIAGERRWRAAQRAGLTSIPVIVRDVDDRMALELAIVENVQRSDLNPVEEALGYQQLIDDHHYVQTDLARSSARAAAMSQSLRLLSCGEHRDMRSTDPSRRPRADTGAAEDPTALAQKIIRAGISVSRRRRLRRRE